ncbi:glutamine synthetase [Candidatus Peregrinibacteria bacterium]|nr:glutamine synthetase [Candidatus Peregrinibacteria bacterium]
MSGSLSAVRVKVSPEVSPLQIQGRDRDYGNVLWKLPHLLDLSYSELEEKNLEIKAERLKGVTSDQMKKRFINYLEEEKGVKAMTVCFSDLEGKLQTLDFDKKHILSAEDNLTFDGSSIKGFTKLAQSDLRLRIDWTSFRWVPSDIFGTGKVLVFANVCNDDGSFYISDFRSQLAELCRELLEKDGMIVNVAPEIEGFLFKGCKAEQAYDEKVGFELATMSGYFNSLPQDTLRLFIDKFAEVQRALGFQNEKDHPEVAPAQFELNFRYSLALDTADQIQLYKLLARQVAKSMGFTACFLPKPVAGLNGSGMHINMSLAKDGTNIFFDAKGKTNLSETAWKFITGILANARDICMLMNPSVNAYRRLDPNFEAPNEIKVSAIDRGSMIRIPMGNEKSARVEVRTVAPDVNPYLCFYALIKAGLHGVNAGASAFEAMRAKVFDNEVGILPGSIYDALADFAASEMMTEIMGEENKEKYWSLKMNVAHRSPRDLGNRVKASEVLYHHEVSNQLIWGDF